MYLKIFTALIFLFSIACSTVVDSELPIIPKPNGTNFKPGKFVCAEEIPIGFEDAGLNGLSDNFINFLGNFPGAGITFGKSKGIPAIQLKLDENSGCEEEGYMLEITPSKMAITSSGESGLFYGLISAAQLLLFAEEEDGKKVLPCCMVKDQPRYGWRGLMLDESRHFFGKEKVKQLLDYMALHKLNKFHWHLTDVPGWRIEIKQYPRLTTIGGIGNHHNPNAEAKFYTQQDIAEIIKYASDRFIEVIPEIDMPGHATAANKAYPEFSGGGSEKHPDFTFNPGKEGTYQYLTNILKEVSLLFPSEYIHIGGDEVHFGNQQWNTDPNVQELMKDENLENLVEVEHYFVRRMADSITALGKKVMGWDEIIKAGLDTASSVIMWWRHDKPHLLDDAISARFNVIMCPRVPLYFDFDQHESHEWGRKWGGAYCPIDMVYNFPVDTIDGDNNKVMGIQANLWSESIKDNKRLDFMTFPRLSAMAEAAWSNEETKEYQGFMERLKEMIKLYQKDNIYYFDFFNPEKTKEPAGFKK